MKPITISDHWNTETKQLEIFVSEGFGTPASTFLEYDHPVHGWVPFGFNLGGFFKITSKTSGKHRVRVSSGGLISNTLQLTFVENQLGK